MMTAMQLLVLFTILLTRVYTGAAQHFQYALYPFAMQQVNPASISLDNYAATDMIYRSQQSLAGVALHSALFSAKYPFISRKRGRWSAAGITVGQERAGLAGALQLNEIGAGYAFTLVSNRLSDLSVGARLVYRSRRINTEDMVTGSQYVEDLGFDPSLYPGENLGNFATQFASVNTGVSWQGYDRRGQKRANAGLSVLDLNSPDESFAGSSTASPIPLTLVLEAGRRIYEKRELSVYAEVLYSRSGQTNLLNIGTVARYQFDRFTRSRPGRSLDFYTKYLLNAGAMMGVRWNNGRAFSLGTSYEIPLNSHPAHQGAFEIGLELGKLVKAKSKRRKNRPKRGGPARTRPAPPREPTGDAGRPDTIRVQVERLDLQADSLNVSDPNAPLVKASLPEKVILRYDFEFGEVSPILEKESIMTEIVDVLIQNPTARVEVVGHTDNVGSENFNQRLSEERARVFFELLVELGIDESRIEYYGEGELQPLNDNSTPELRNLNRRVEVMFHYEEGGKD